MIMILDDFGYDYGLMMAVPGGGFVRGSPHSSLSLDCHVGLGSGAETLEWPGAWPLVMSYG